MSLAFLLVSGSSPAITILSEPVITRSTNAPLAGLLRLITDFDSRVAISVTNSAGSWSRNFYEINRTHSLPLAGFKPGQTNLIYVTVFDQAHNSYSAPQPVVFTTPKLPADFPRSTVLHSEPAKMEPGYTLCVIQNRAAKVSYMTVMDHLGEVVWYCPTPAAADVDVRQLPNGDFFVEEPFPANRFLEIDLLGQIVRTWSAPAQYPVNNHEGLVTDHGTILYLSDVRQLVTNFPSNTTNPQAPRVTVTNDDNPVVEISAADGALLNAWSPLDMMDPTRVTYLTYSFKTTFGVDNEHANAIIEDKSDDSIIVSLRTQDAVFKFLRSTGRLKWILGPHANWSASFQPYLLSPVGSPFAWNYGQHAPQLTPRHTLLLYDDGNNRADPFAPPVADQDNHSRAVEYDIDETNRQISQVWDSTQASGDRLYTPAVGNADWLPQTTNVLVTYGLVTYVNGAHPSSVATNATMVRIRELTHDPLPQVVFDISFFDPASTETNFMGYLCYRSHRIADLYSHPAMPVQDLTLTLSGAAPRLLFSADPFRTYSIEASTDLLNWQEIGSPTAGPAGSFSFQDPNPGSLPPRFYRILTR